MYACVCKFAIRMYHTGSKATCVTPLATSTTTGDRRRYIAHITYTIDVTDDATRCVLFSFPYFRMHLVS
uniref:Uncharacterized protein n=1 Tax=Onchocerca volvulus TaxID=6282 RepID=A0A2K6VIY9_ONCVO